MTVRKNGNRSEYSVLVLEYEIECMRNRRMNGIVTKMESMNETRIFCLDTYISVNPSALGFGLSFLWIVQVTYFVISAVTCFLICSDSWFYSSFLYSCFYCLEDVVSL